MSLSDIVLQLADSTQLILSADKINILLGSSGSGKTSIAKGMLADTVERRMHMLKNCSGLSNVNIAQCRPGTLAVSKTPPLIVLDQLPKFTKSITLADYLAKILGVSFPIATSICKNCNGRLVSNLDYQELVSWIVEIYQGQRFVLGVLCDGDKIYGHSHVIVNDKEIAIEDFNMSDSAVLLHLPIYAVTDRFILTQQNSDRLLQLLSAQNNPMQMLVGDRALELDGSEQLICPKCFKILNSTDLGDTNQLTLGQWICYSKNKNNAMHKSNIQMSELSSLVEQFDLAELTLDCEMAKISRPLLMRLYYIEQILMNYRNRLIVIDLPYLPSLSKNIKYELRFLEKLQDNSNLLLACVTEGSHLPKHYNIIQLTKKEVRLANGQKQSVNVSSSVNCLYVANQYTSVSNIDDNRLKNYLEALGCKGSVVVVLDSFQTRWLNSRVIEFPGLISAFSNLFERLPRARELGYTAPKIRSYLKNLRELQQADQLCFSKVRLAELASLSIAELLTSFTNVPQLSTILLLLNDIGLGRLTLQQNLASLSHAEIRLYRLAYKINKAAKYDLLMVDYPALYLDAMQCQQLAQTLNYFAEQKKLCIIAIEEKPEFTAFCQILD